MKRNDWGTLSKALGICLLITAALPVAATSPRRAVQEGNRLYEAGEYDRALEAYAQASVDLPESPIVAFNEGTAFFKKADLQKARESFERAALATQEIPFEASCRYNLGNVALADAQRQRDSDPRAAVERFQEAAAHYQDALRLRPDSPDAAHNLEVARILLKQLLDEMNKDPEGMKQRQEQNREMQEELQRLIQEQQGECSSNDELSDRMQEGNSEGLSQDIKGLSAQQRETQGGTRKLSEKMQEAMEQDPREAHAGPSPMEKAREHLEEAGRNQGEAVEDLDQENLPGAKPDQDRALENLKRALQEMGGKPQPQQQQQQQQQQETPEEEQQEGEQEQQPQEQEGQGQQDQAEPEQGEPLDEQARDILNEERENKEKRKEQKRPGYVAVERDW